MYPEDLLAVILKAAVERAKIDPKIVNDIQTGNVLQELGGIKVGRAAMFTAGKIPYQLCIAQALFNEIVTY
jgi:acetyl-CoA acyltransferase 1